MSERTLTPEVQPQDRSSLPAALFVILSLVIGFLYLIVTPPFQAPDEWNHVYRAWAIAEGEFEPRRHEGSIGFDLPPELPALALELAAPVVNGAQRYVEPDRIHAAFDDPPPGARRVFVATPTTAFLTSLIYAPQATGIALGKLLGISSLACLYLARLMNLLAGTALIALAIHREPWRPWLLMLVALGPMAAFLRGSASADVVPMALAFWFTARVASFALVPDKPVSRGQWLILTLGAALLTPMKLVYAPIALAACLIPDRAFASRAAAWRARIGLAVVVALSALYASAQATKYAVPFRADVPVDPHAQMQLLMAEPLRAPMLVVAHFAEYGDRYLAQIVGQLGWLAVNLPKPLIIGYSLVLLFVWWIETRVVLEPRRWVVVALLVASVAAATSLTQYLIWTALGADFIDGVQGRYLLPLVPLAAWLMPFRGPRTSPHRYLLPVLTVTAVAVATVISLWKIVERYYPAGFELLL